VGARLGQFGGGAHAVKLAALLLKLRSQRLLHLLSGVGGGADLRVEGAGAGRRHACARLCLITVGDRRVTICHRLVTLGHGLLTLGSQAPDIGFDHVTAFALAVQAPLKLGDRKPAGLRPAFGFGQTRALNLVRAGAPGRGGTAF